MAPKAILVPFTDGIRWCSVPWWEDYEGKERVQKRMKRIKRQLNALYNLRLAHWWPQRVVAAIIAALREKEIEALARRPISQIKARMKRYAAMVPKCFKPKPNGKCEASSWSMFPSSDDLEYDLDWEWEIYYDWLMQRDSMADGEHGVLDEEAIAPYLPQRKRDSLVLKLKRARSKKWGCESHRAHRSWKSRRLSRWRVLADFSVSPT